MKILTSITLITLLLILWGCSKDTVPTDSALSDEDKILSEIQNIEGSTYEDYFYSDLDEESEENFVESSESSFQKTNHPSSIRKSSSCSIGEKYSYSLYF